MPMTARVKVELPDLFLAYRRAKCDAFYERTFVQHLEFAEYEDRLEANLTSLRDQLLTGEWAEGPGELGLVPKHLSRSPCQAECPSGPTRVYSDQRRAFADPKRGDNSTIEAELSVRPILDASVDFRVVESLWIERCGAHLDSWLGAAARANRVARIGPASGTCPDLRPFRADGRGTFPPFWQEYRRWRDDGLNGAAELVRLGRPALIQTFDLRSFYYRADAAAVLKQPFMDKLVEEAKLTRAGRSRAADSIRALQAAIDDPLSSILLDRFSAWRDVAIQDGLLRSGGHVPLPIGCSSARILANVLLAPLDREIERAVRPWYFGRYVDDYLLVSDGEERVDVELLLKNVPGLTNSAANDSADSGGLLGRTSLELADGKERDFYLTGTSGSETLSQMRATFDRLSSERRLLPSHDLGVWVEGLVGVDIAVRGVQSQTPTLRQIDGISARRFAFSMLAGRLACAENSESVGTFLDAHLARITELVCEYALAPDALVDLWDQIPRLVASLASAGRRDEARDIANEARAAFEELVAVTTRVEGPGGGLSSDAQEHARSMLRARLDNVLDLAIDRGSSAADGDDAPVTDDASLMAPSRTPQALLFRAGLSVRLPDLLDLSRLDGHPDAEITVRLLEPFVRPGSELEANLATIAAYVQPAHAERVGEIARERVDAVLRLACAVRPPAVAHVFARMCSAAATGTSNSAAAYVDAAAKLASALRGGSFDVAPTKQTHVRDVNVPPPTYSALAARGGPRGGVVRVAVASVTSDDDAWAAAAAGDRVDDTVLAARLRKIQDALRCCEQRADYLVLPELLLPEPLAIRFAELLAESGTSLVTGLLYDRASCGDCKREWLRNRVLISLAGGLGDHPAPLVVIRTKASAARGEAEVLRDRFGELHSCACPGCGTHRGIPLGPDSVITHGEHAFAVQICSELLDIQHRSRLAGAIDTLFNVSWNSDLKVFDPIVEAASWDLHCFVVYCNVQQYGGSRVRGPFEKDYQREVAALRGGHDPYVVVAELPIAALRRFHSRASPLGQQDPQFKPTSPEFQVTPARRTSPPAK